MKNSIYRKSALFVAISAVVTMAPLVGHAQSAQLASSVEIYGLVNAGITYVNNENGSSAVKAQSGVAQPSRFGLRGNKDFGEGLTGGFVLENGFDIDRGTLGQGGRIFGRQAFLSIGTETAGKLMMGRQYDSIVDFVAPFTATGQWGGISLHPGDIDNTSNSFRINNALKYVSPTFGGFTLGGLYSVGGVAGNTVSQSSWSVGGKYKNGGFSAGAAYLLVRNPASSVSEGNWTAGTMSNGKYTNVVNGLLAQFASCTGTCTASVNPDELNVAGIGAAYELGPVRYALSYTRSELVNIFRGGNAQFTNTDATLAYRFDKYRVGVGYTRSNTNAAADSSSTNYDQVNLFGQYAIRENLDFILLVSNQRSSGANPYAQVGAVVSASPSSDQTAVSASVRLRF